MGRKKKKNHKNYKHFVEIRIAAINSSCTEPYENAEIAGQT